MEAAAHRSYGRQHVEDAAVQTLAIGHDVPQGVEVPGVLDRQAQQRQEAGGLLRVRPQQHPGVGLGQQQPVGAGDAQTTGQMEGPSQSHTLMFQTSSP